jgi:YbbR-like protein
MKELLLRNAPWKLLAIGLAALVWFTISGQKRQRISERGFVIPLTVVNLPSDLVIASPLPDSVDVRLRGPFRSMRQADPAKMEGVVDLAGSVEGERAYKLAPDDINAPTDLEVVAIKPLTIPVKLSRANRPGHP